MQKEKTTSSYHQQLFSGNCWYICGKNKEVVLLGHVFLGSRSEQFIQTELMKVFNDESYCKRKNGIYHAIGDYK